MYLRNEGCYIFCRPVTEATAFKKEINFQLLGNNKRFCVFDYIKKVARTYTCSINICNTILNYSIDNRWNKNKTGFIQYPVKFRLVNNAVFIIIKACIFQLLHFAFFKYAFSIVALKPAQEGNGNRDFRLF